MKYIISSLLLTFVLLSGCITPKIVNKNQIKFLSLDGSKWNLEQCNNVIDFYTVDNTGGNIFNAGLANQKVYIRALLLNTLSIKAISRKEVIEKRLKQDEYFNILDGYLYSFMNFKYNFSTGKIVEADTNFSKGYTFKVFFENISNPFEPIFLEDGYSYFFLENLNGDFSRVIEVTGIYVEEYFQLDGYLNAIITFSPFSSDGKKLFNDDNLNESYRLVFNGLQTNPIIIEWKLNK